MERSRTYKNKVHSRFIYEAVYDMNIKDPRQSKNLDDENANIGNDSLIGVTLTARELLATPFVLASPLLTTILMFHDRLNNLQEPLLLRTSQSRFFLHVIWGNECTGLQ